MNLKNINLAKSIDTSSNFKLKLFIRKYNISKIDPHQIKKAIRNNF